MMSEIIIGGNVKSALTHFSLLGLARLAEEYHPGQVRLWWSSEAVPRAVLKVDGTDLTDLARHVQNLAHKWSDERSWTQVSYTYHHGKSPTPASPFSPRIKAIKAEESPGVWDSHQRARIHVLDQLDQSGDWLSLQLIAALGEPAYWRFDNKAPRPDHGASRWEMKTRNRGEEFVTHRMGPLCREIAGWDVADIAAGLAGESINDTIGKNSPTSRTSTGFTPPGPADPAQAFAALLGIASFPMARKMHKMNVTPGAFPTTHLHPAYMVLPLPHLPVSLARFETIMQSEALATVIRHECEEPASKDTSDSDAQRDLTSSVSWLRSRGIPAVSVFPILKVGSDKAPERQVQSGRIQLL